MGETVPFRSERKYEEIRRLARLAMFDELIDMHLDGMCTLEEAVAQYKADVQYLQDE